MSWPRRLRARKNGPVLATIYRRSKHYPFYRLCAYVGGKRRMSSFHTYSDAKKAGELLVKDLAKGSQRAALSQAQALDALAAFEKLRAFERETGRKLSLLACVSEFAESAKAVPNGHTLREAVEGFGRSVVSVKRVNIHEAIEDFIAFRKGKTVAINGRKPQLSEDHWRNTSYWLKEFAQTFPGLCVCDLSKPLVNKYLEKFSEFAPKTRNERRGVLKMFLGWAVEQDFLANTHRLLEASQLKHENADVEVIECYTAGELRSMLERCNRAPAPPNNGEEPEADYRELLPVLALAGLGGLREKEILRLSWQDVFRVPGHIEVGALKAKTRSRRLVEMCSSLAQWLESYRARTGPIWPTDYKRFHAQFKALRDDLKIQHRRNGLRHSYISSHYALHSDEGLTAKLAGNSPQMVHKNYKGLLTRKEGEAWFAVVPVQPANVLRLAITK